jgi:hypothetical protein
MNIFEGLNLPHISYTYLGSPYIQSKSGQMSKFWHFDFDLVEYEY